MSDPCRHCSYYGKLHDCRQAECFQHESWYAVEMIRENEHLRSIIRRIMSDLPSKKDWLDPALEAEAKEMLG
jgi:hypothetical protein